MVDNDIKDTELHEGDELTGTDLTDLAGMEEIVTEVDPAELEVEGISDDAAADLGLHGDEPIDPVGLDADPLEADDADSLLEELHADEDDELV